MPISASGDHRRKKGQAHSAAPRCVFLPFAGGLITCLSGEGMRARAVDATVQVVFVVAAALNDDVKTLLDEMLSCVFFVMRPSDCDDARDGAAPLLPGPPCFLSR